MKMTFEHRKQKVISFPLFVKRMLRYALSAFLLIIISVLIGTAGYRVFAGSSWLDSFHMACMILTGMGPVMEMKTAPAKIFSSIFALYSGVAFLSITAVFLSPIVHRFLHILHVEKNENE